MPKISVIVPVYNTEKYLHRCVDSILAQTFTDFELLLVNDGSTDGSGAICDEYAQKDSRVRVFHKENGGVSSARNIGLDNASGEWITFVDSDDWLDSIFLEKLCFDNLDNVDIVISYAKYIDSHGILHEKKYTSRYVEKGEIGSLFLENDLAWQTSPWAKLYKKEMCNRLRFVEGMHIGEDLVFLYTYIWNSDRLYINGVNHYNYDISVGNTLTKRVNKVEEELYCYNTINDVIIDFILKFKIKDKSILSKLNWIVGYYVRRVLNAIYYDGIKRAYKERISVMKSLDIDKYVKYIEISSLKEKVYVCILRLRLYILYDLVRKFVAYKNKWSIQ